MGWLQTLRLQAAKSATNPKLLRTAGGSEESSSDYPDKHYALVSTITVLLLFSCRTVEKVLRRILHQYLGLIVRLVTAAFRRLTSVCKQPLNIGNLAKLTTSTA